ncbi:MAG: DUF1934 domain-containing protein [Oscillospiraceae bacterium]|nr:DUF1934 domain-containing protein [Oscillospiraceae bacterium]
MKKDVLINIKSVQSSEDDYDIIELFTTGQYYKRGGCFYISYEESESTGYEGSTTTLKVEPEKMVTLVRTGTANSQLIVERGVRHQCHYDVGYGDLLVGVQGSRIKSTLAEDGGNLEIKYSLDINSMYASENEMYIQIKESAPKQ